ncbi:unnamed protein product [Cochlearia groenlandica]
MDCGDDLCTTILVLSGKSCVETEIAIRIKNNNTLKLVDNNNNTQVSIILQSDNEAEKSSLHVSLYMDSLSTRVFGKLLIWSPRVSSTHDVVSPNFSELPLGTVCVADVQFKGRGRSKNVWESPKGCLMYSFILQMKEGRLVPLIQYAISLAITEAVKSICDKKGLPLIEVKIKWPNDLYLNGLKVGGILCTSTYTSNKFNISVGIGLNVDNEKPTTCLNSVLKVLSPTTSNLFKREEILGAFFNIFETFFDLIVDRGFESLEELYYRTWLHSEQKVIVEDKIDDQIVQSIMTIKGLTSSGYLLAMGEDDNIMYELHPDGNSFDFFNGLIRRKL